MQRYPSDLEVTAQDFADCGWQSILADTAEAGYEPLWRAFSKAAELAVEAKMNGPGKALWLLADACAMRLLSSPDNRQQPFASTITHLGWRTAGPDDFIEADLDFFAQVVRSTDNSWLKARLADLLWVRKYKSNDTKAICMALDAIDNYQRIPINTEILQNDWQACWERAITLVKMLGKGAADKLNDTRQPLLHALHTLTKSEGWLAWKVSDLLQWVGLEMEQSAEVANKLATLARDYDTDTEQVQIMTAGRLFRQAAIWFGIADDKAEAAAMTVQVAECYVREGRSRIQTPHPSYGAAASFYEQAIQTYRTISRQQRQALCIEVRITALRKQMDEAGEKSLGDLGEIPFPEVDFREQMVWASQAVQNKTLTEALQAFSRIVLTPFKYQDLWQQIVAQLKQPSLMHIFPVTVLAENGRVIARIPCLDTNADLVDEANRARVFWEMTRMYRAWLNFYVNAFIWPALGSLLLEHRLREADLIELASRSPIVPIGRERLFGKALFAGFNHDFVTALHLLVPQVENMVRYHLKHAGARTTHLDEHGVQTENGISTLIDQPEAEKVFGRDVVFEIKALYCTAMGPNLRNKLAHGLLNDTDCQSIEAIYAWWLGLRLVCHAFWNAARTR
ncbi:DUF4209 domain-containing protein [Erwinia sp. HDF1-3R]|uniref:DUF4209 domain-containing protein n=1 Tax=Erwinia sp. HDF1-3R TaxID=3141543 RepID=UPI0031F4FB13